MAGPFTGLKILDLTTVIAGPYCCYQLVLMGAGVIKVEMPGTGDFARQLGPDEALNAQNMGASFLGLNAGKRSITLNLKHREGREIFLKLVQTADVLVENFRPGVMERLQLGHDTLRTHNQRLIYCAISGFGQDSPLRENPAFDQIIQGLSGAMGTTGTPQSGPLRAGYPVSDTVAGLNAAFAIAAALTHREKTCEGQFVDVSMYDSTISIMGWVTSNYLIAGQEPELTGNDNFTASPSGSFRCQDGLINIAANKQAQFEALCKAVGRKELIADERFRASRGRIEHRESLKHSLEQALAARTATDWAPILNRAGVPADIVRDLAEAIAHPHTVQRGTVSTLAGTPGVGRAIKVFTAGWQLAGKGPQPRSPPPALGQHNGEVLAEFGYSSADLARLAREGVL